ncbi:MAG: diphosphomevalonate decarboxylase [Holophagales bacterium]|nr:diphosphomevalonate decarboxylase [Holophagales bacterium]
MSQEPHPTPSAADPGTGRKATVVSPSNIAFIKYWGARDLQRVIPENPSLSMTLHRCHSRSTVEWLEGEGPDEIRWRRDAERDGGGLETAPPSFAERVRAHLDRLRRHYGCGGRFRVATENSFPSAAGLASSASGFSALTLGVIAALGKGEPAEARSDLARRSGSGSASRSVYGGYVLWPADPPAGDDGAGCGPPSHAEQIFPASHWELCDVIAIVETGVKEVSSLDGHRRARTSPLFEPRLAQLPARLAQVRRALAEHDFPSLGEAIETDAIELHCVAMTSIPAIYYWKPPTLAVLEAVRGLRRDGVPAYATLDAGANVHVICEPASEPQVAERLGRIQGVSSVIRDGVGEGPSYDAEPLF